MKIGIAWPYPSSHGGVQRVGQDLYHQLTVEGHDVRVIVTGNSKLAGIPEKHVLRIGISVIKQLPQNSSRGASNISWRPYQIFLMLKRENFDIIHFHNMDVGIWVLEFLWIAALMKLWPPWRRILKVLTFHGAMDASKWQKILPYVIKFLFMPHFHGATATSPASMQTLEISGGLKKTVHNGIDLDRFTPNPPDPKEYSEDPECAPYLKLLEEFSDGKRNLYFTGRFEKRKGLLVALEVYKELCESSSDLNIRLIISGEGEMFEKAEQYVKEHDLPDVHFIGWVPEPLLAHFYALAYILLAPSLYAESFGLVLLEAMACGTVPLGFANIGYQYLCSLGGLAEDLLVESGDSAGLAEKGRALLLDPEQSKYNRLRQAGLDLCMQFALPLTTQNFLDFYQEAMDAKANKKSLTRKLITKVRHNILGT